MTLRYAQGDRSRRNGIAAVVDDAVTDLLYYDRKESESLPVGAIEEAIAAGEVSVDEMVEQFTFLLKRSLTPSPESGGGLTGVTPDREPEDGPDGIAMTPAGWSALREVLAEITRAHSIHGRSVETGTDSDRARILLCEAVEASQAVDAVTQVAPRGMAHDEAEWTSRRSALRSEVVQVAAVAFRWLLAEQVEVGRG